MMHAPTTARREGKEKADFGVSLQHFLAGEDKPHVRRLMGLRTLGSRSPPVYDEVCGQPTFRAIVGELEFAADDKYAAEREWGNARVREKDPSTNDDESLSDLDTSDDEEYLQGDALRKAAKAEEPEPASNTPPQRRRPARSTREGGINYGGASSRPRPAAKKKGAGGLKHSRGGGNGKGRQRKTQKTAEGNPTRKDAASDDGGPSSDALGAGAPRAIRAQEKAAVLAVLKRHAFCPSLLLDAREGNFSNPTETWRGVKGVSEAMIVYDQRGRVHGENKLAVDNFVRYDGYMLGGIALGELRNADLVKDTASPQGPLANGWKRYLHEKHDWKVKNDPRHAWVLFAARIDEFDAPWMRDLEGLTPRMITKHMATIVAILRGETVDGHRVDRAEMKAAWEKQCLEIRVIQKPQEGGAEHNRMVELHVACQPSEGMQASTPQYVNEAINFVLERGDGEYIAALALSGVKKEMTVAKPPTVKKRGGKDHVEILLCNTKKGERGKGYGRLLVSRAKRYVREKKEKKEDGFDNVQLVVVASDDAADAVRFYHEKCGFNASPFAEKLVASGGGYDGAVCMEWRCNF